jgi:hypothetical protein
MKKIKESGNGSLFTKGTFLIPVLKGTYKEMGAQYGELMKDEMQKVYDIVIQPQIDAGGITDEIAKKWTHRALSTFSTRNKDFYEGLQQSTGWPIEKIGMLDQVTEFGIFQSKIHSFAGCTSIMAWDTASKDGNLYIGRNMDWSAAFSDFAQVLTVVNPTDGGYRYANLGWPGMITLYTGFNEHGVYIDLHDGSSMGGSVVFADRAPFMNVLVDILSETKSLDATVSRFNASRTSVGLILSMADQNSGASMECACWGDHRVRRPDSDTLVVVNTFLNPDWGIHKRDTVSHSLERYSNMTAQLAENKGNIDAQKVRDLMDIRLFNEDGTLKKNGGCTKPTKQDADQTTHQMVTDIAQRKVWLKVPNPKYLTDWVEVDLKKLWS